MSDCSSHPRRQACALCIVFSLILNVHPSLGTFHAPDQDESGIPGPSSPADLHGGLGNPPLDENPPPPRDGASGRGGYRHVIPGFDLSPEELKGMRVFLKKIFAKYGEGEVMSFAGFQKLMDSLDVGHVPLTAKGDYLEGGITRHVQPHHHRDHHTTDYDDYEYVNQNEETSHEETSHEHETAHKHGSSETEHQPETEVHDSQHAEGEARNESTAANEKANHRDHQHVDHEHHMDDEHVTRGVSGRQDPVENSPVGKTTNPTHFDYELTTSPNLGRSGKLSDAVPLAAGETLPQEGVADQPKTNSTEGAQNDSRALDHLHDAGDMGDQSMKDRSQAQANFRTRRLSSIKPHPVLHTDMPLFDIPPASAQGHVNNQGHSQFRRHALRHRRQRQNSYYGHQKAFPSQEARDTLLLDELAPSRFRRDIAEGSKDGRAVRSETHPQPDRDEQCLSSSFLLKLHDMNPERSITETDFLLLCPALIQQIDSRACHKPRPLLPLGLAETDHDHDHEEHGHAHSDHAHNHSDHNHTQDVTAAFHVSQVTGEVWGYAFLSVFIISLVGLLSVAVVPIMQKVFYNHLLQFLVGLAVGTLTGDALLHLIPHALGSHGEAEGHAHGHGDETNHGGHDKHMEGIYRGLVILMGVYFFFLTERLMGIITSWRRRVHKKKGNLDSPKMYRTVEEHESEVGAKLSKHSDVVTSCEEFVMVVHPGKDVRNMAEDMHEELHRDCEPEEREQLNHSHSGGHGHSHGPLPNSIASVAWMVIMGDGLHNFSDGLAIGAAFASGLPGGLSTSVAVFCHELPHEIGDFAVLLRAGMSVKQAIVYNCVSSILCVFGLIVGVCVGNIGSVSLYIFALAGGMFIYIALVDMLPELTSVQPRKGENPLIHLALQNMGMIVGAGIMAVIAIYEDDITLPSFDP